MDDFTSSFAIPSDSGATLIDPPYAQWAGLIETNRQLMAEWEFLVAGMPVGELRDLVRRELAEDARSFSARFGVEVAHGGQQAPVVMSGHQPELYHPGVWVKVFLLQRIARETGSLGVDLVVDTDGFRRVGLEAPDVGERVSRGFVTLADGEYGCFACSPVPTSADIEDFVRSGGGLLRRLDDPELVARFDRFAACLRDAAPKAENLSELITFARRSFESPLGRDYLSLPVTTLVRSRGWATFVAHLACDAARFAREYNTALADYRTAHRIRTGAQPFPDLKVDDDEVELPFWLLAGGERHRVSAKRVDGGVEVLADSGVVMRLPVGSNGIASATSESVVAVLDSGVVLAPRALTLTMFTRLFACDFFIHGVGGGRYDRVTDDVCRRYFAAVPPRYAVASLTMRFESAMDEAAGEAALAHVRDRLHRLRHNPDTFLDEAVFSDPDHRSRAEGLASEKRALVDEISHPEADRKWLGIRIKQVNAELASALSETEQALLAEAERTDSAIEDAAILGARDYSFFLWSPERISETVW